MQHFALEHQIFQRFVRKNQRHGGRRLIALTAFHAHQAVFNHVDAAIAVLAGNSVQFVNNAQIAFLVAVDGIGNATGKRQLNVLGLVGSLRGVRGHGVDVRRRFGPRVLQHAALDSATPQVVINRIRGILRGTHFNAMLFSPLDFIGARQQVPLTHGSENFKRRVEHGDA